jgi:hypothetical protein
MISPGNNPEKKFLWYLGAITIAGLLLRLNGIWSESITADEADTLWRIKQSPDLKTLLNVWVKCDGHPPFIHLLEYFWTKIFGISEGAVRFPFVLMGAGAIWFAGRIAQRWFGSGTAMAVAAGVAFLQFPLMYSQLARPYSPGLFFSMMLAWYWTKWFFSATPQKKDLVLFVIAGLGAAYSHYFSLLFAGMLGVAGLFFLRRETWKPYLLAGITIIILFLPYIKIFIYQLGVGGVGGTGGWLGKPTPGFLKEHVWFIFDESRPVVIISFALTLFTMIFQWKRPGKFHLLAFCSWFIPLAIGYVYSQKSPVLQNSVLLFSFPFLLMLLFAWIPPLEEWKRSRVLIISFSLVLLGYVTIYKPFHLTDHFGRLKELVSSTIEWRDNTWSKHADIVYNVDIPYFIEYNYEQLGEKPENVLATVNNGGKDLLVLKSMVQNSEAEFFIYGWSTRYSPPEALPIIREKFPYLVEQKTWFNSAVYLFTNLRALGHEENNKDFLFYSKNDFDPWNGPQGINKVAAGWTTGCTVFINDTFLLPVDTNRTHHLPVCCRNANEYILRLDSTCIYSPSLKMKVGDILKNPDNEILFTANMKLSDSNAVGVMVIEFYRDGKSIGWNGMESDSQIDLQEMDKWQRVYFGLRLPKDLKATDTVNFYCYSKNGKPLLLDYLEVKTLPGHKGIYGPRPDLK